MRSLFIPPLGTELTLAEPWTFDLYDEHRNSSLIETLGLEFDRKATPRERDRSASVTLPAGSVLKIDRLYIKKGQGDFDSVTFFLKGAKTKGRMASYSWGGVPRKYKVPARAVRFWAKLACVNKIQLVE